ncbi:MAG TPA: TetR/AcrR family transcriptional regulator [Candidatus Binataceae bacterium]|nr:TetR/AcrR family transcriptional regulator [Candidatus Binataceae bacterium]
MATKEEILKNYRVSEILEAARRTIGRFGFEGTTIDRVADEARIAKGTIYLYFPNKDALLHSAVVEGIRDMTHELARCDDQSRPPIERLARLIRSMFKTQRTHEDFFKALILDSRFVSYQPEDRRGEELHKVYLEWVDYFAGVLRCAAEAGAIRAPDPQLAALMLAEMMTAPLRRRLLCLTDTAVDDDAEAVIDMFLYGVRGLQPKRNGK